MRGRTWVVLASSVVIASLYSTSSYANDKESWYTYWGLGYASNNYTGADAQVADALNNAAGVDHLSLSLDMFGFYWPVNGHRSMLGAVINGSADSWTADDELSFYSYLYSASMMHFFGEAIGEGLFLRADLGAAVYRSTYTDVLGAETSATSDFGIGALIGAGYAFPISGGTRMLLNVNYGYRKAEGTELGTLGLSAGFLF